tara:strand:+ start:15366 stop:16562 length:1197 start_codon:yes stop_codon:yes gene_type:complete
MIPKIREAFNQNFKEEFYENVQKDIVAAFGEPTAFRLSETPVFISKELKTKVFDACDAILEQLDSIDVHKIRNTFIPKNLQSPAPLNKPHFLAIDFGLCEGLNGEIVPQLIELQAFPTLFFYQPFLGKAYLNNYPSLAKNKLHYYFSGLDETSYLEELKTLILGNESPENVVLLEIHPEKQKTRIDFWATQKALGIPVVCITKVIKEGKKLFYERNGSKFPIHRIYNRVIFDEIQAAEDLKLGFNLNDDLDVQWVTHPDWFFIISKCMMPLLAHTYIPKSYYLNDFPETIALQEYVLKPLFSFAGKGVNLNPTQEEINKIQDKQNYILQKKVSYASLIKTPSETNSKVELRILFVWNSKENRFKPVVNLTRMSKGELINVSFQTKDTWIGSSISYFEE